jgi:hypothetical protein
MASASNWRVQQEFLKSVNDPVFQFLLPAAFDSDSIFTCFRIALRMRPEKGPTRLQ